MSVWYFIPHPYRQIGDKIILEEDDRRTIARAFQEIVRTGCSYLDAASVLYAGGITPPEGGYWTAKIEARWFFENPIHAGHLIEIPPGKERGNPIKKSPVLTIYPVNIQGGPAVDVETWLAANADIRQKELVIQKAA
jgi:hypothetical protein